MYGHRLRVFVTTCLVTIVAIAWTRPPERNDGTTAERFWSMKTHAGDAAYDVVIAGDSRALMGVAPTAMHAHLAERRILNFGYLGAALTPEFVAAAARKLDPDSSRRTLVLAVTPLSVSSVYLENAHFNEQSREPPIAPEGTLSLDPVRRLFAPLLVVDTGAPADDPLLEYREHGWMASHQSGAFDITLRSYAALFARGTFDEANFARLVTLLADLGAGGVRVLAFRHPSSPAMEDLEARLSGFRERRIRERLAEAGVEWLSFEPSSDFISNDGSHLLATGALAFSAALARRIAIPSAEP